MENLAHTLLGLSLAKAGLERATPLATTTLVISSNLPDVDAFTRLSGDGISYLQYHRGFTHSFVGLALLAAMLTALLVYLDRKFRLRRDPFRRPIRPIRIFCVAYLGGLGHTFMDYTNSYGVRPLLPFSNRWFYGDLVFVVDPWIWLILGSAVVWLTATRQASRLFWLVVGAAASLLVALALRDTPQADMVMPPPPIPGWVRAVWFAGLFVIIAGLALGWRRAGGRLARYSLLVLAIYYAGMWMAHQSAMEKAGDSSPVGSITSRAAWPAPANPLMWQAVLTTSDSLYTRYIKLTDPAGDWRELSLLDPIMVEALRQSQTARAFLDFCRYGAASVDRSEAGYTVALRDLRFPLQMTAALDQELAIKSVDVRWY